MNEFIEAEHSSQLLYDLGGIEWNMAATHIPAIAVSADCFLMVSMHYDRDNVFHAASLSRFEADALRLASEQVHHPVVWPVRQLGGESNRRQIEAAPDHGVYGERLLLMWIRDEDGARTGTPYSHFGYVDISFDEFDVQFPKSGQLVWISGAILSLTDPNATSSVPGVFVTLQERF
jgi:hypothetical protein